MSRLKVAFFSSEIGPFAKVGGLGDVAGSLPKYLREAGIDIRVISGKYEQTDLARLRSKTIGSFFLPFGARDYKTVIHEVRLPGSRVTVYLLEQPEWISRGEIYGLPKTEDDPHFLTKRFLFLSRAGLELLKILNFRPDILHANDWPTAPAALIIKQFAASFPKTKTLLTVHNITHGGFVNQALAELAGLTTSTFSPLAQSLGNQHYFDLFAEALLRADSVNTVSKTYAHELLRSEFSGGLKKIFAKRPRELVGILNGIDTKYFNPATDPYITARYNSGTLQRRSENKSALQRELKLAADPQLIIYGVITRLTSQKGIDLLTEVIQNVAWEKNRQFVILGEGEARYKNRLRRLQAKFPRHMRFISRYDTHLARRIYAGSDIFLMPSHFEPCGLTQMIGMRYGALPLVHKTGGLADTVIDHKLPGGNGFVFGPFTAAALLTCMHRAEKLYQFPKLMRALQKRAMRQDFSWGKSAEEYLKLYQSLL